MFKENQKHMGQTIFKSLKLVVTVMPVYVRVSKLGWHKSPHGAYFNWFTLYWERELGMQSCLRYQPIMLQTIYFNVNNVWTLGQVNFY